MSNKEIFKKETITKFFVLAGSLSDLSKIDFSSLNIQCLHIDSEKLLKIGEDAKYEDWENNTLEILNELKKDFWDSERLYVLLPIDFSKKFSVRDFYLCHEVLLLLFPSDLSIKSVIEFQLFDDKYLHWVASSDYDFISSGGSSYDNYLYYHEDFLVEINSFIEIFFKRFDSIKYLRTSMSTYVSSFYEKNPVMSFLSLCISLESIINGTSELTYKISRSLAILISDEKSRAETIYANLKLIYDLRSKIVHGSEFKFVKVIEYLPYLRSVASRMMIEIVLQNIKDIDDLNYKLTFAGFGGKESLSNEYKNMTLNITSYVDSFRKSLSK